MPGSSCYRRIDLSRRPIYRPVPCRQQERSLGRSDNRSSRRQRTLKPQVAEFTGCVSSRRIFILGLATLLWPSAVIFGQPSAARRGGPSETRTKLTWPAGQRCCNCAKPDRAANKYIWATKRRNIGCSRIHLRDKRWWHGHAGNTRRSDISRRLDAARRPLCIPQFQQQKRRRAGTILTSFVTPPTDIDPTCLDGALPSDNDATLTGKDAELPPAAAWTGATTRYTVVSCRRSWLLLLPSWPGSPIASGFLQ